MNPTHPTPPAHEAPPAPVGESAPGGGKPATGLGALLSQWAGRRPELAAAAQAAGPLDIERDETDEEAALRRAGQDRYRAAMWEGRIPLVNRDASLTDLVVPQQDPGGRVTAFLGSDRPVLLLVGPGGHGKSNAGVAVGNRVRRRGGICAYWDAPALRAVLCDNDRSDMAGMASRRRDAVYELETADLVMIDDLGAEQRDTPWGSWTEWLWRILTERAENGKLLIIDMNGVDENGEAIVDQYDAAGHVVVSKDVQVAQMLERRYGARVTRRILDHCSAVWVEGQPLAPRSMPAGIFGGPG